MHHRHHAVRARRVVAALVAAAAVVTVVAGTASATTAGRTGGSPALGRPGGWSAAPVPPTPVDPANFASVARATPNQVMVENPTGSHGMVRASLPLVLAAGETRLLHAQSVATQGTPDRNAIGQKITCERPDGQIVRDSWSGSNMLAVTGTTTVAQRMLFTAPEAGTYFCRLRVYVDSHFATPARAVLVSGYVGDVLGTITPGSLVTPHLGQSTQFFPVGVTTPRTVVTVGRHMVPAGTRLVEARADLFLTNCYGGGGAGCPLGTFPARGSSTYAVRGVLVPTVRACPRIATQRQVLSFGWDTHHIGNQIDLTAKVPPGSRCGYVFQVTVEWLAGLPFVVQLYPYSQASLLAR